jgi:TRAP-type C4-dicarboxylate transport system substrate-binding protein
MNSSEGNTQVIQTKSKIFGGLIRTAVALLALSAPAAAETPVTIKLATLAPEGSSWMQVFKSAAEEVRRETANAVQFKIYPGGVLGDERDMIRKMHIGQIQAAVLTSAGLSNLYSEIDVLQIPFLFNDYAEVDHVIARMQPFFDQGLAAQGHVLLGWSEAGFVNLMSTAPADTLEKLKKSKVWIWNDSPMAKAIFQEAGVIAVPLTIPDVLVGLQTGLVEVVYSPPSSAIALQWFTRVKYLIDTPLLFLAGGLVVKKGTFDSLPEAQRGRVRQIFERHLSELKATIRKENQTAMEVIRRQGVQFLTPAPGEVEQYKQISARAMAREGGHKFSEKVREEVLRLLADFRGGSK